MSRRLLLCTDLDRTLLPNGSAQESPGARDSFKRFVTRGEVRLAYVSGRDRHRVEQAVREYELPLPDFVIADVGTTIYDLAPGVRWARNHRWEDEIGQDWADDGYDRLSKDLRNDERLQLQEASKQNRFKLSFYVDRRAQEDQLLTDIGARLARLDVPGTLVYSFDEPRQVGLLDVLPEKASKLHAILFVMRESSFGESETVFCGDSGNDLSVLTSRIPGVLVANAADEVKRRALRMAESNGTSQYLYMARGSFLGMNGNYAAGILEGVCHFHPAAASWLKDPG
jgi:sucrose-6-phosphatase